MRQLDTENADYNLATEQAVLSHALPAGPDAYRLWAEIRAGDGAKDLAGDAVYRVRATAGGVEIFRSDVHVASGVTRRIFEVEFTARAGETVALLLTGAAADTDVDVTAYLYTGADVSEWLGGAVAAPDVAGVPKVDITHIKGWASAGVGGYVAPDVNHMEGTLGSDHFDSETIRDDMLTTLAVEKIRDAITGGAYALDTDYYGRVRIVNGTGAGELESDLPGVVNVNLVAIDGETTDGNNATLHLKRLDIQNADGAAGDYAIYVRATVNDAAVLIENPNAEGVGIISAGSCLRARVTVLGSAIELEGRGDGHSAIRAFGAGYGMTLTGSVFGLRVLNGAWISSDIGDAVVFASTVGHALTIDGFEGDVSGDLATLTALAAAEAAIRGGPRSLADLAVPADVHTTVLPGTLSVAGGTFTLVGASERALDLPAGYASTLALSLLDASEEAVDLTSADLVLRAVDSAGDQVLRLAEGAGLTVTDAEAGQFTLAVTAEQAVAGRYRYELGDSSGATLYAKGDLVFRSTFGLADDA